MLALRMGWVSRCRTPTGVGDGLADRSVASAVGRPASTPSAVDGRLVPAAGAVASSPMRRCRRLHRAGRPRSHRRPRRATRKGRRPAGHESQRGQPAAPTRISLERVDGRERSEGTRRRPKRGRRDRAAARPRRRRQASRRTDRGGPSRDGASAMSRIRRHHRPVLIRALGLRLARCAASPSRARSPQSRSSRAAVEADDGGDVPPIEPLDRGGSHQRRALADVERSERCECGVIDAQLLEGRSAPVRPWRGESRSRP